jgi:hypothetical protein
MNSKQNSIPQIGSHFEVNGAAFCNDFPTALISDKDLIVKQLTKSSPFDWSHVDFACWIENISLTNRQCCCSLFSRHCIDFACFLDLKKADMIALGIILSDAEFLFSIQQSYLAEINGINVDGNFILHAPKSLEAQELASESKEVASFSSLKPRTYGRLLTLGHLVHYFSINLF